MSQSGYLVIADISGYTAFLNESELDHAKDSLNSLLTLLVEYTKRPLLISRLEGDAVISYALDETVTQGQTLVELIENTYLAFRKARELMIINTSCQCRACKNIPNLDLKFFIHHGEYSFQRLTNYDELVGSDVNLVHRLTKNTIVEITGLQAYAAYTKAAVKAMGIDALAEEMTTHVEQYEHIGEVHIFVQDLKAVWKRDKDAMRFVIEPDDSIYRYESVMPFEPAVLWDYLTRPEYRAVIHGVHSAEIVKREGPRNGIGTVYECFHGNASFQNVVVDWQPFEQITSIDDMPVSGLTLCTTYFLEPVEDGTRLSLVWSDLQGPLLKKLILRLIGPFIKPPVPENFEKFRRLVEEDLAESGESPAAAMELSAESIDQAVVDSLAQAQER